jgi:tetratricopeptide (TPR) repeat protein
MRLWTVCCPRVELRAACLAGMLLVLVLFAATVALGQTSLEDRYNQAIDLFHQGKKPDLVCEILTDIQVKKKHYKEVDTYVVPACSSAKAIRDLEKRLFDQGDRELAQGSYSQALQDLQNALQQSNVLNKSQHRDAILKDIQKWKDIEAQLFQRCNDLYSQQSFQEAVGTCDKVAGMGGTKASSAQELARAAESKELQALKQEEAKKQDQARFDRCSNQVKDNLNQAIKCFDKIAKEGGSKAAEAQRREDELETKSKAEQPQQAQKAPQPAQLPKPLPSSPAPVKSPGPTRGEGILRDGILAFLHGDYPASERDLSRYLAEGGPDRSLAYFFRGAAHAGDYFLSGEQDTKSKNRAMEDFRSARRTGNQPLPPSKMGHLISPKIRQLFQDSV